MSTQYDWDKNEAVVDRLFYMQYTFWLSSAFFGSWLLKDLWFIQRNWYADRSRARIPKVKYYELFKNSTQLYGPESMLLHMCS